MATPAEELLAHLGRLAAELGAQLAPSGHYELLQSIAETAREMFGAGACSIALLDRDEDVLVFHVATGGGDILGSRVPVGEGIAGWVVASGQPIVVEDVATDDRFARDLAEKTGYMPRSIMAMPLETERETIGVIEILDADPQANRDMALMELFARQAALALESEAVFHDMARVLFEAAARASDSADLALQLRALAAAAPGASGELAGLAADMSELTLMGSEERAAAAALVHEFAAYARRRGAW